MVKQYKQNMCKDWLMQELFCVAVRPHFMTKVGLNFAPALGKKRLPLLLMKVTVHIYLLLQFFHLQDLIIENNCLYH